MNSYPTSPPTTGQEHILQMSTVVRCVVCTFREVISLAVHIRCNIVGTLHAVPQVSAFPRASTVAIAHLAANRRCSHIGERVVTYRTSYLLVIAW